MGQEFVESLKKKYDKKPEDMDHREYVDHLVKKYKKKQGQKKKQKK